MIGTITEKTDEFLQACKEAGYERVTIFVHDKRVPDSVLIKKGSVGDYWGYCLPGGLQKTKFKVVCGSPARKGPHPTLKGVNWPAMWGIVRRLGLNSHGGGNRDGHDVNDVYSNTDPLTAGYYDLAELAGGGQ